VPLRVRGRPVGTLTVWRVAAGAPHDADDLRLLQDLADRAGLALDNVDLFRQQEWAAERTRHLHEITGHLSRSLDAEEVLGAIARSAAELLGAPVGAVFLLDPSQGDFALAAAHGLPAERRAAGLRLPRATSLAGRALDAGLTLVVDDAAGTPGTALPALLTGQAAGSEMAAPIVSGTERLGVIKVFSPTVRRFGPEEADLLGALAAAAAVALTNARLYREAREAVRARDEFLSVAAHELKTPLAGLIGNAQLLARTQARGLLTEERVARSTGVIAESGRRLAGLVDDLLDVSRIRSGQLALRTRPVDLGELVAQIAEAHAVTLDDAHRIETLLPAARSTVEADPERLRQVVENLLDNAVKYSPSGGTVRIELVASADGAELRVVDQGIGLPPDALEAIFQPFGRAANAVERALPGMGLGLYICRDIVERHGGRLWVESPGEDRGTIAHVFLPRQPLDGTAPT
jgi:signal transduction histidine kinase